MSKAIPALLVTGIVGYLIYSIIVKKEAPKPPTPQPTISIPIHATYEVVRG
jgi:hypothetical protein